MAEASEANPSLNRVLQGQLYKAYVYHEEVLFTLLRGHAVGVDQARSLDRTLEETEQAIFKRGVFSEEERRLMRVKALSDVRDFWTKTLEDPNLPSTSNAATMGRSRITEITQRLEELAKPPENPQSTPGVSS